MKKLLIILLTLFTLNSFAQNNDTLIVSVGKYNLIKIGDKVYKINYSLEEVKQEELKSDTLRLYNWPLHTQNTDKFMVPASLDSTIQQSYPISSIPGY